MIKKILTILIAFVCLTIVTFWGYLQTSHAQSNLKILLQTSIKEKTGLDIKVENLSFPLPFNWKAQNIQFFEKEKLLLTVGEIGISIPLWELLGKKLAFNSIDLTDVHLFEIPSFLKQESSSSTIEESSPWKKVEYTIRLSRIHIQDLVVESHLLPMIPSYLYPLEVHGSLIINPKKQTAIVDIALNKQSDESQPVTRVNLAWQDAKQPTFHLNLLEQSQGPLSKVLGLSIPFDFKVGIGGKFYEELATNGKFSILFLKENEISTDKQIGGSFSYEPNQLLNLKSIEGEFGRVCLSGEIAFDPTTLTIHQNTFKFKIFDCEKVEQSYLPFLKGSLEGFASANGGLTNPRVELNFTSHDFKINNLPLDQLTGKLTLTTLPNSLQGYSSLTFNYLNSIFKSEAHLDWSGKILSLINFKADYGDAHLEGNLDYFIEQEIVQGSLSGSLEDSSFIQNIFAIDLSGSSAWDIKFHGTQSSKGEWEQDIDFAINAERARYEKLRVQKMQLYGTLKDLFKNPGAFVYLTGEHAHYNGWKVGQLKAETAIEIGKDAWPFQIATQDQMDRGIFGQALGNWHMNADRAKINLQQFEGYFKEHHLTLNSPMELTLFSDLMELSPLSLSIDEGSLFTNLDYTSNQAHANIKLHLVPLEIFYPSNFMIPINGLLSGDLNLVGQPGSLTGELKAQLTKLRVEEESFAHMPFFEATLSGQLQDNKMTGSALIKGITKQPVKIHAELPIHASLNPPDFAFNQEAPLKGHLEAEGEVAPLLQLLVIDTTSFSGNTSVSLDVNGTFINPHVTGQIAVNNGTFESPNTGAIYRNIHARLEANDKILILKELSAIDLSDGIISGQGTLQLKRDEGYPFILNLNLSRIRLLNLDFAKAIASGKVVISGNSRRAKVEGHLTTNSIQATIPEQSQALAHTLNVRYINLPKGEVSPIAFHTRSKWPLELNIQIDVPNNASIKSKDLYSSWHGGVKVQGTSHDPLLFGDFKINNGEYHFNGKTFDIKEGTITFAGEPDKKTTLYVIGSKDLGKIVAEVILKGSVKNPAIAFRSNPPMSQRDILSWILFGRSSSDISPFQGTELSQSIKDLTKGKNKSPDMLTKIRESIGIDKIDISKSEGNQSNEVSIQVGKYISRGVLVSVNKSITAEANQIGIEANLLNNIKAEAQVGDDASANLQLKWKHDY